MSRLLSLKLGHTLADVSTVVDYDTVGPPQLDDSGHGPIVASDSDFLYLRTAPSMLGADIGLGVFARHQIQRDSIICEYRGELCIRCNIFSTSALLHITYIL